MAAKHYKIQQKIINALTNLPRDAGNHGRYVLLGADSENIIRRISVLPTNLGGCTSHRRVSRELLQEQLHKFYKRGLHCAGICYIRSQFRLEKGTDIRDPFDYEHAGELWISYPVRRQASILILTSEGIMTRFYHFKQKLSRGYRPKIVQ